MSLPFSQACENNKQPILQILQRVLINHRHVFEIGSGTAQHAVYFAPRLTHLTWQVSDVPENLYGIRQQLIAAPSENLPNPVEFDLRYPEWPAHIDAVFTANTLHIVPWPLVRELIAEAGRNLPISGLLLIYGPFNYRGNFTSESNAAFDAQLRAQDPERGIRDFEAVDELAQKAGFSLMEDNAMPANNRLLIWQKQT